MKQQIFVDNVTVIDLSRWSFRKQAFRGDSFNLHCKVSGPVEPQEGVVVDFSKGKKEIKAAVDRHVELEGDLPVATILNRNGFDHKLVLPSAPRFRTLSAKEAELFSASQFSIERTSETHCAVTTKRSPQIALHMPLDALKSLPADILFDLEGGDTRRFQAIISEFLATTIEGLHFTASLDRKPHTGTIEHTFGGDYHLVKYSYTHGLRNSSSFGCQNIAHGHSSFVASVDQAEALAISSYLHGAHIYDGSTWDKALDGCAYETRSRGTFTYSGVRRAHTHLVDVGAEPSIENIAAYVASELKIRSPFFLSEGLQKGCYWEP